jgi:hypothetical protein
MKRSMMTMIVAGMGGMMMVGAALAEPDDRGYRVPNGHMPPPGECRVWLPDTPPGQQPPPSSCRAAERNADRYGGRVIYGGRERRGDRYDRRDRRYDDDDFADRPPRGAGSGLLRDPALRLWAARNFDRNGDGRLNSLELDAANVAFFRFADRNGDGRLSTREFQDARLRLRG